MDYTLTTHYGDLCGEQCNGYVRFLGVPYAKPPLGELRFRKPVPVEPWKGVKQAKQFADYCYQPGKADTMVSYTKESEDCLYLNIYTPACDAKKRPVMIWIHGGAYLTGTNSSCIKDSGLLAKDSDIVVVAIQYRLGGLGFIDFASLSGSNGRFDTNCGMWDQVAAIDWVIQNIADFGGDPDCITLQGESAGACSVLSLITSPYVKGKVKRAVIESPVPHIFNTTKNGRFAALDVAHTLGLEEDEAYKIADLSSETLKDGVTKSFYAYIDKLPYTLLTAPVVDGDLLPETPYDAIMHGAVQGIEVIIGTCNDEATMFVNNTDEDILPNNLPLMNKFFDDHPSLQKDEIYALYKGAKCKKLCREIGKEIFFHIPSLEIANELAKTCTVFVYQFNYVFPLLGLIGMDAIHTVNSVLTAGSKLTGIYSLMKPFSGKYGKNISRFIHSAWGNFIATGDPNSEGLAMWTKYNNDKKILYIDKDICMTKFPHDRLCELFGGLRPYGN